MITEFNESFFYIWRKKLWFSCTFVLLIMRNWTQPFHSFKIVFCVMYYLHQISIILVWVLLLILLYSLHNGLTLLHKYMSRRVPEFTITCDTICLVNGESLPHWTLSFLSTNYCLTLFACTLFLLLEYICFSINLLVFPHVFLLSASQQIQWYLHVSCCA